MILCFLNSSGIILASTLHHHEAERFSLRASPAVPLELKLPVELNSFSDASSVCEPANESLF